MSLEACLPVELRGPTTTLTRIAAGASGAGVYRVEAAGQTFVLKIAGESDPIEPWRRKLHIQQAASDAGVAPRIIHADEARRAILSAFVVDRSFPMLYGNPDTRELALVKLGQTIRRVHALPVPPGAKVSDPREFLATLWSTVGTGFPLPSFVGDAVQRRLAEDPPAPERAPVLSHNDVNPTNLAYDGENLLLLDWETAGPNDPFYDLAAISVFLRMDEATCLKLLSAYDGGPVSRLSPRFAYCQRMVAALCGTAFLNVARGGGHAGATGQETLDATPSLMEVYQRMRSGTLNVMAADGRWWFGLALIKASLSL